MQGGQVSASEGFHLGFRILFLSFYIVLTEADYLIFNILSLFSLRSSEIH